MKGQAFYLPFNRHKIGFYPHFQGRKPNIGIISDVSWKNNTKNNYRL